MTGIFELPPWNVFVWWQRARRLRGGATLTGAGGDAAIGVAIFLSVLRARKASDVTTYGSARWASRKDVEAAGLRVVLDRFDERISATTDPSTCCASQRRGLARASGS